MHEMVQLSACRCCGGYAREFGGKSAKRFNENCTEMNGNMVSMIGGIAGG